MKKVCISKGWKFIADGVAETVDLPHDFAIKYPRDPKAPGTGSNGFFAGPSEGTYTKYLKPDEAAHTILDIDGAYMCAHIYINDDLVDMHPHGYTPYLVDISDRIFKGINNKLGIRVLNNQPSTRWYSGAGVYRDVFLWYGGSVRIEPWDMYVTTDALDGGSADLTVHTCISADSACSARVKYTVLDGDNTVLTYLSEFELQSGKNPNDIRLELGSCKPWSIDEPNLYLLKAEISVDGALTDRAECVFGVRTVSADSKCGLLINGKSVKLQGGCIHHDHGVLGAAEFPSAVERKLRKLKAAGFTAVRCAHNPPSLTFLEVCDRIGMIVMDEAFDMWNERKMRLDYSLWFRDWCLRDVSYMVMRDRAHPCVISYSTGNEIIERDCRSDGAKWAKLLADEIRKYDDTRLVTSCLCGFGPNCREDAPEDYRLEKLKAYEGGDVWEKRTSGYTAPLDIVGHNYGYRTYADEPRRAPGRVLWGSETQVLNFYDSWKATLENAHVIGDFTWTAFDNLGEAGTGRYAWGEDEYVSGISVADYPWRACYQGDFDLCGYRRPQSYFREAIWKKFTSPHIFTTHPKHNGDVFSGTGWHWYDVHESWSFNDEYIGKPVKCDVYTGSAERVEFYLNGKRVGEAKPEKGIASLEIPYERGVLTAISYVNALPEAEFSLKTVGEAYKLVLSPESTEFCADNRELCYIEIAVTDENGNIVTDAKNAIRCEVFGGEFVGLFSGDPANEDEYGSCRCHAYEGRALLILRGNTQSHIRVFVTGDGLKAGESTVEAKKS